MSTKVPVSPELFALAEDALNMLERGLQDTVLSPRELVEVEHVIISNGKGVHLRALRMWNPVRDEFDYRFDQLTEEAVRAHLTTR